MNPEQIAPKSQASSSVWNPLVKQAGFVPQAGKEAVLLHPESGVTVYFLPPSAGMKVSSNWQVGEQTGRGWPSLESVLRELGGVPVQEVESSTNRNGRVLQAKPGGPHKSFPGDLLPLRNFDVVIELADGTTRVAMTQARHFLGAVYTARWTAERTMTAEELASIKSIHL